MKFPLDHQPFQGLVEEFDELRKVGTKKPKSVELNELPVDEVKEAWLKWISEKLATTKDPLLKKRLDLYLDLATRYSPFKTFLEVMVAEYGHAFRRLETRHDLTLWTDAAAVVSP